jgi:hypothetical protein
VLSGMDSSGLEVKNSEAMARPCGLQVIGQRKFCNFKLRSNFE